MTNEPHHAEQELPVVALVASATSSVSRLLAEGPPGAGASWLLVAPLPQEIVTSDSWLVIRMPPPLDRAEDRRGVRGFVAALGRGVRLGRLLADADVIAAADHGSARDVRFAGALYRKPVVANPGNSMDVERALARRRRRRTP